MFLGGTTFCRCEHLGSYIYEESYPLCPRTWPMLTCTLFAVLWLVASADLLWEKNTAGWLVLVWCERKTLLTGCSEQSGALPVLARGDLSSKFALLEAQGFINIYACNYTHIPKVVLFHGPLYCHGPFCFKLGTDTWQWYGTSLFHAYHQTLYGNIQVTLYSAKGVMCADTLLV